MIVGVLLAAGEGSRFEGGSKLLAELGGEPVVARAAAPLLGAATDDVLAVTGHRADEVGDALESLGVRTIYNPDYRAGQSGSVRRGVEAAALRGADAVVVALGDMPCVAVDTVDALVERYRAGDATIVAPEYDGRRGNPVLFDRRYFAALRDVTGDEGGRRLLREEPVALVETDDPGVALDVDTVADLERAQERIASGSDRG